MKNLLLFCLYIFTHLCYAQTTVTTITSEFSGSGGLSLDAEGNLYIGDFGDFLGMADTDGVPNNVLKLDTDLNLTVFSTDFIGASGNDFDSAGILHQSDIRANAIYKIVDGVRTLVTSDGIVAPVGIVFDSNDNFFVCNCGSNTIQKVTPDGSSTEFATGSAFACPNGITVDENDNLYISNFSNTNIVKITPDGTTTILGNTPAGNGHIDYDINTRNLYIASYAGQQIFSLNLDSTELIVVAGTGTRGNADGDATTATFSTPNGIAVSDDGNTLFVNCAVPLSGASINPQIIRRIDLDNLSLEEYAANSITAKAYPVPTADEFTIQAQIPSAMKEIDIQIYDIKGQLLKKMNKVAVENGSIYQVVDIAQLPSGVYFYTLDHLSEKLYSGRIIKK